MGLITTTSWDGKHTLVFNPQAKGRAPRYKLDGKPVIGVTTLLKASLPTSEALVGWKVKQGAEYAIQAVEQFLIENNSFPDNDICNEIISDSRTAFLKKSKEATDIGTLVHEYALLRTLDDRVKLDDWRKVVNEHVDKDKIRNGVKLFEDYLVSLKYPERVVKAEYSVASPEIGLAGSFDILVERNGIYVLKDYKTSSGIYPDMFIQLAFYAALIKSWMDITVEEFEVVRLGKEESKPEVINISDGPVILGLIMQAMRCAQTYRFLKEFKCGK